LKQYGDKCSSNLMVLWIDSFPDYNDFNTSVSKDLNEMPVASLLGLCGSLFCKNKLLLDKSQLIYYGLVDKNDNLDDVRECMIPFFSVNKINTLGIDNVCEIIKNIINNQPVHISLDMKVFDQSIVKSVIPVNNCGLKLEHVEKLLLTLKNNIVSMDIAEFNPCVGTQQDTQTTREMIRYILSQVFDIKEKSLNIFSEDSQFLVFRPVDQEDPHVDIGWYILRGIPLKDKNDLLNSIIDDQIITIEIDDNEYFVTKTTINEQNEKSYYSARTISDVVLFPQEKAIMVFELVN